MNDKILNSIAIIALTIAALFVNPLFFQWFWNNAIIECVNAVFQTPVLNTIDYWFSFLILNVIVTLLKFFRVTTPTEESTEDSGAAWIALFLNREAILFNTVIVCIILTKLII